MLNIRLNSSLWPFTVSLYHQPGVEEECLLLQDRFGVNVNLLFLCLYAGSELGVILTCSDIDAAEREIAEWNSQVVKALRRLRRLLKRNTARSDWPHSQSIELLRAQIKDAELEAERIESTMLQEWFDGRFPQCPGGTRHRAVATNVCRMLAHYGAGEGIESSLRLVDLVLSSQGLP